MNQKIRLIGRAVALEPWLFISCTLIFTSLCSLPIPLSKLSNDVTDFTPYKARARKELQIYENFFARNGQSIVITVFITAKNDGTMLGTPQLNESVKLIDAVSNDVLLLSNGKNLSFSQFCTNFCDVNEPIRNFKNGLEINTNYNDTSSIIDLAFPVTTILGRKFRIDTNFFGLRIAIKKANGMLETPLLNEVIASNELLSTEEQEITVPNNIKDIRLVLLHFRAELPPDVSKGDAERYELDVVNFIKRNFTSDLVDAMALTPTYVTSEIVRGGLKLLPFTAVGFIIMCIFSTITLLCSAASMSQASLLKVPLAISACASPLLACGTALGLLLWCGMRFGTILCVTPFLVLAIGVDDAFLMINSWQRIGVQSRKTFIQKPKVEDINDQLVVRFCMMLEDIGPSVAITTITNVFAFGVGALTPTPEIQLFCIGNALAMLIDFIYQVTLFGAIMALIGRTELRNNNGNASGYGNKWLVKHCDNVKSKLQRLISKYCRVACTRSFTLITMFGLLIYWLLSLYGAYRMKIELKPVKLLSQDTDLIRVLELRDQYIMPYYAPTFVFVGRPGSLSDQQNVRSLHKIVEDFEALPSSVGRFSTNFWLRDFEKFIEPEEILSVQSDEFENTSSELQQEIIKFLDWPEFSHWKGFLQFEEQSNTTVPVLKNYFFTISSHGNLGDWSARGELLDQLRMVADKHQQHAVSVFDDDAKFLDLIATLLAQTVQSSGFTMLSMMLVCIIFMGRLSAVLVASFSILSTSIGVVGVLSLWGIDLDPIVMCAVIMSIGFSVDIPAHVTYHFFKTGQGIEERLHHCMSTIAFPVIQATTSTLFCMVALLFIDLHMARVFVKTMALVVIFGLLHGFLIIPVIINIVYSRPKHTNQLPVAETDDIAV